MPATPKFAMSKALMLIAIMISVAPEQSFAQETPPDIEGRAARVWPLGAESPILGRVTSSTTSLLVLETDDPFCGANGCERAYSVSWPTVDRLQVGRLTSMDRAMRAGALGLGLALLLGPGLRSCGERNEVSARRCEAAVIGVSAGFGVAGYLFTRQSWQDVSLPR